MQKRDWVKDYWNVYTDRFAWIVLRGTSNCPIHLCSLKLAHQRQRGKMPGADFSRIHWPRPLQQRSSSVRNWLTESTIKSFWQNNSIALIKKHTQRCHRLLYRCKRVHGEHDHLLQTRRKIDLGDDDQQSTAISLLSINSCFKIFISMCL